MSEIQEWVETRGASTAQEVASLVLGSGDSLARFAEAKANLCFPNADPEYRATIAAALAWKAGAILSAHFIGLAEGWCEAYYRDLWKLYSEEKP
jgi:hypothetical protein